MDLAKLFQQIAAIDGSSLTVLMIMSTVTSLMVRKYIPNLLMMLVIDPLMLGLSVVAYGIFVDLGLFNPKKMTEWLIFAITAGSAGTSAAIMLIVGTSRLFALSQDG
ncbi:MAG: hypothetical protein KGP27_12695 [Hyphomicrobiales bacterium]|nr:hypothetical protein [Hyphomicrobiales bacterium]